MSRCADRQISRQFHAPVRFQAIRGPFRTSIRLEAPTIEWGPSGQCWAYLHDFEPQAVERILADFRDVTCDRHGSCTRKLKESP